MLFLYEHVYERLNGGKPSPGSSVCECAMTDLDNDPQNLLKTSTVTRLILAATAVTLDATLALLN
jgi:hypothetical protein